MKSVAVEFGSTLTTAMNLVKLDIDCVVFHLGVENHLFVDLRAFRDAAF